jgi:hypothetical protein
MKVRQSAILLPFLLLGCSADSPEIKVKRTFEACVKGVEQGDAGAVAERLDSKFAGPEGMDKNAAKLYLLGALRQEKIGVTVLSNRIDVQGREALQTVELLLTSREGGGLLPKDASRRTFLLRWTEKGGTWRLRELADGSAGSAPTP